MNRTALAGGWLAILCLVTPSCMTAGAPYSAAKTRRGPIFQVELVNQDIELDELEIDSDNNAIDEEDLLNVEKERRGVRFAVGARAGMFYIQVAEEEFETIIDPAMGRIRFESDASIGIGGMGEPVLTQFNDDTALVLAYRAGMNFAIGETEGPLITEEEDYATAEFESEVAIGVDVFGLRPAIGLYGSTFALAVDDDDDSGAVGFNAGGFFDLRYKHPEFPIYVAGRAQSGDVDQDFLLTVGARF